MPDSLADWLAFIEARHPQGAAGIELGLDRVRAVSRALGQHQTPDVPVIIVAGTNGKGSTCAMLERILGCAGYRVGLYTSPHLLDYNERIRIDMTPVGDVALCDSFARIEQARLAAGDIALTYFEFGTLAAWECFAAAGVEAIILEVGLGGRLDAVNIYDADCAIVTGIDLDHCDYLGDSREAIGREKAGIFRAGKVALCSDPSPPQSLIDHARDIGADLRLIGRDFGYRTQDAQWQYWSGAEEPRHKRSGLAHPALRGAIQLQNAAGVLAALDTLRDRLPVSMQEIRRGLIEVELPGRFQTLPGRPAVILDVAHNPQAARVLADNLGAVGQNYYPATWAVFGMLRDKDIDGVIHALGNNITHWLPCTLPGPRAASGAELADRLAAMKAVATPPASFESPAAALRHALKNAGEDDRIVVFGSFLTVAAVMREIAAPLA